jgi:hypothetical protein
MIAHDGERATDCHGYLQHTSHVTPFFFKRAGAIDPEVPPSVMRSY